MGLSWKIGELLPLLPDETVLHSQQLFRAMTIACFPSVGFAAPFFLSSISLRITDRRCLVRFNVLRLNNQEIDLWFPGCVPNGQTEIIKDVSVGRNLLGTYLRIRSHDPRRESRWYLSPNLTLKLYCANPEELEGIVTESMKQV